MSKQEKAPSLSGLFLITGLCGWASTHVSPLILYGELQPLTAIVYFVTFLSGLKLTTELLNRLAGLIDWLGARQVTGKHGTAHWATWKHLKAECKHTRTSLFWGRLAKSKKVIFSDFVSNAMCVAPAGSGKGIFIVITSIFAIRASKVIADFKGELVCVTKKALEKRGEIVRVLNPGNLWSDIIGQSDQYNPLDIITDDLYRPGGLRDVPDDLREMTSQIYPEPEGGGSENTYWREGSRRAIADAILIEVMLEGYDATLSSVALLIEDRQSFEYHLRWIVGIDLEGKPLPEGPMPIAACEWAKHHDKTDLDEFIQLVKARANNLLILMTKAESRTYDSFASGAQQALAPFAFGRLAPAMRRSTFSMNDLKDTITSLFIVSDASRQEAYKPYIGLIQWCAMTAMKRHPKKDVPVYYILDEATNYIVHGLTSLLTWGRSYGLRLLIIFQDLSAFQKTYGDKALETLLSETEIKCFLPGQRSPKTLELIKKLLGEQSIIGGSTGQPSLEQRSTETVQESARPLYTEDEIRRSQHGLLFIRQQPTALIEPIAYAEISPWRKQADINPFHGKPFLKPVKCKLKEFK